MRVELEGKKTVIEGAPQFQKHTKGLKKHEHKNEDEALRKNP